MKTRLALLLGACLATAAEAQQAPPLAPPHPLAPAPVAESDEPSAPAINLGDKSDKITPGKVHDGLAEGGELTVEAKPGVLTVLMTGAAHAHCFAGFESVGAQDFRLAQEFEVVPVDPKESRVVMTLAGKLNGYVRSVHKGGARMRVANASVYPAGGGDAAMSLAFAPARSSGTCARRYSAEYTTPEVTLPAGKFTLVVNFAIDAAASGIANGHGQADFATKAPEGLWAQTRDPFKDEDRKDFGFALTLTAAPGHPPDRGQ